MLFSLLFTHFDVKISIGVLYERYTKSSPNDSVIIQGLLGRMTGYDDNGLSICFTNVDTIGRYKKLNDI